MTRLLARLSPSQLEALSALLGRMDAGDSASMLRSAGLAPDLHLVAELSTLREVSDTTAAHALRAVAAERRENTREADRRVELVWTGPERDGAGTRDTSVVARDLFARAVSSVLVSGYAMYNARAILEPLAVRKREQPSLRIRFFLNIQRRENEGRSLDDLVAMFRQLLQREWPETELPETWFDPRSLDESEPRAVLHAKYIVADEQRALVTSANLTDAAHQRNIELGVLLNDAQLARSIVRQFEDLVANGHLRRLP